MESMKSNYISVREFCEKYGKDRAQVIRWIQAGRLPAAKVGKQYIIPADTQPPADARVKSGKYRDWRKPKKEEEQKPYVYIPEG